MKVTPVALLALLGVAAAGPTKKNPGIYDGAGWDYCATETTCYTDRDCQVMDDCLSKVWKGDVDFIACGVDFVEPHTCWEWIKGQPH
ncbi:hypothetical protein EMPG_16800 [Blastomyces silverae]|uniref:Extracellular membrane protein CFEM domain-containing protein n=1 Tax=Blastomyces silverae TaxID=2060906 RepID=A0A0H1B8I7_9EURO|nr:hypothetical protein EMPG_16800 [Blastomyces silverae]